MTVFVAVVSVEDSPGRAAILRALDANGAMYEICTEATAIAKADGVHAIVFDAGDVPERLAPVCVTLANDARTKLLPRVVLVGESVTAERIATLGAAVTVERNLAASIADLVATAQARVELQTRARIDNSERRIAERTLGSIKNDGITLAHDTRVLFGVILGYAGNLRDGFAGPVSESQRTHLVHIVEAANDAASLFDRYVTNLKRSVEPPSGDRAPSSIPRALGRRLHNDLAELVRNTTMLFGGLAATKGIELRIDADRAHHAWCDAMQVKQALVNLIANALKFTPQGGVVEVAVRLGAIEGVTNGASARRDVEIVVSDSGPGIPEAEREYVFGRGVRLPRDKDKPGTGIGLAVVRDVAEQHSGVARVEESARGGAAFVLALPTDLRTRATDREVTA